MYKRVLIPLDGSQESERVIPLIKQEMEPDAHVVLLKVLPIIRTQVIGGRVILGSQREEAERLEALSYLRSVEKEYGDPEHWRYESITASSSSEGIVLFAQGQGVDVIAMYAKERRGLTRLVKGNTARAVLRNSPVEVRMFGPKDLVEQLPEEALTVSGAQAEKGAFSGVDGGGKSGAATGVLERPSITPLTLKDTDLFRELSIDEIDAVASLGERLSVPAGELLGQGGQSADELFVIVEGEAQLSFYSEVGDIAVRVAGSGESFPMAALLGSGTLITTGKALTDMELLSIPRDSLAELCSRNTDIGMKVYKAAAQGFANRYSNTLTHLAASVERELKGTPVSHSQRTITADSEAGWLT